MTDQPLPPDPAPTPADAAPKSKRRQRVMGWVKFTLRWGIAVVGIWLVVQQIYLHDRVWVIQGDQLVPRVLTQPLPANANEPQTFQTDQGPVKWDDTANKPDLKSVKVRTPAGVTDAPLVGLDLRGDLNKPRLERVFVIAPDPANPRASIGQWLHASQLVDPYHVRVPYPRVETGLLTMIRQANGWLLLLAVLIFPVTFVVTSVRWDMLLRALDIHISLARAFVLNMVGAFYNSFMVGSTGGDILKAYYVSKHTTHRTRAVLSVVVDRIIGLLALVLMGGVMATIQYLTAGPADPAGHACGRIALVSTAVLVAAVLGFLVLGHPTWRRATGTEFLLGKLPKQKQVKSAVQTMEIYARRPLLVLGTLLMTLPVHVTVVLSAMLASKAFGLTISPLYYFVAVPVIVLVGAIPISPQGAGVMEYFAILLLARQGATVSQAFALTMSIRMVQILWNLTGGIFVFRGGYHQPTEREREDLESDTPATPAVPGAPATVV